MVFGPLLQENNSNDTLCNITTTRTAEEINSVRSVGIPSNFKALEILLYGINTILSTKMSNC
jgi:hypothetical protein